MRLCRRYDFKQGGTPTKSASAPPTNLHNVGLTNGETQSAFSEIVQSLVAGDYNAGNRDNLLAKADPWIIAKAKTKEDVNCSSGLGGPQK